MEPEQSSARPARPDPPVPAQMWAASVGLLVVASVTFVYAWTSISDPDLWGHLRFGEDFLRSGHVTRADIYSYLPTSEWVNHEWLAEATFAVAYRLAGAAGLIGLKLVGALFVSVIAFLHLRGQGMNALPAGLWLMVTNYLMLPGLGSLRPQMFTCAFFVVLLVILESAERRSVKRLWWLPPLFILWVNMHGGVLAGVGTLLLWAGAHALAGRGGRGRVGTFTTLRLDVLTPLLSAVAATLVNPYGPRLWWFLRTALGRRLEIAEWTPLAIASVPGAVYLALAVLASAGIVLSGRSKSPGLVTAFFVLLLLPLLAIRHVPLFAIGVLLIPGRHIADLLTRWSGWTFPPPVELSPTRKRLMTLFVTVSAVLWAGSIPRLSCLTVDESFPIRAVDQVKRSGATGNMVVHFDWGEYVLWHLGPAVKVSIDGRRETLYTDDAYMSNLRFEDGVGEWDTLLRDRSVTMVLASKAFPSFNLMRLKPGWVLVSDDGVSGLFGREDSDALRRLEAGGSLASSAGGRCFP